MSHLHTDRLAALGDDEPTSAESVHLSACAECARERAAYRTLVAMAHAERDSIGLPLTRWDSITTALADESPTQERHALPFIRPTVSRARIGLPIRLPMQAAAAVLLVAGGVVAGRMSAAVPTVPSPSRTAQTPSIPVSNASLSSDSGAFSSVDEARDAQLRAEAIYQQAASYLAQHDSSSGGRDGSPVVVQSRLAALDQVISTTREAMRQAPHDPVINGYYLTTLGQREATLRQLNTVMPASLRANSF
ncbi:MAG: hypothetical protein ABI601_01975 [bacterium]